MISFLRNNAKFLSAGFLLNFSSAYGQTYFIAIFAGVIQAQFGLSHGEWGGLYALATTASAVVMVWAGVLTDIFRVRLIGPIALIALALACLAMSVATHVVVLGLSIFALRFFGQGMVSHISLVAMARWYVARRGKALAFAGLGYSVGEACLPILFVAALGFVHWQSLWVAAAAAALIMVPILRWLLSQERTPQSEAARTEAAGMAGQHWTRLQALRHPLIWLVFPTIIGFSAFITSFFFQQVHLAEVKGWTHAGFVSLFPLYTGVGIVAMFAAGNLLDRIGTGAIVPFIALPMAMGFFLLGTVESLWGGAIVASLIGISHGASAASMSAFWAEFYGTRHLGAIRALASAVMVFGSAIGPGITGLAIDLGLDFPRQGVLIGVFFLISSALIGLGVGRAKRSLVVT